MVRSGPDSCKSRGKLIKYHEAPFFLVFSQISTFLVIVFFRDVLVVDLEY